MALGCRLPTRHLHHKANTIGSGHAVPDLTFLGQDAFRALALGASAITLGRPLLYGSALGGAQGDQGAQRYTAPQEELMMTMQLAGTPTIKSIVQGCVERAESRRPRHHEAVSTPGDLY